MRVPEVTVRFFAAAEEASGQAESSCSLPAEARLDDLLSELVRAKPGLAEVLPVCSYLRNGVAARDLGQALADGDTIDVLPPFSGG